MAILKVKDSNGNFVEVPLIAGASGEHIPYKDNSTETISDKIDALSDYSTDEQVIGTWIDGKPIYKKTFYSDNASIGSGASITIATISGFKSLIKMYGFLYSSNYVQYYNVVNTHAMNDQYYIDTLILSGGSLQIRTGASMTIQKYGITVEYTKTTD